LLTQGDSLLASVHPCITPELQAFIARQPLFFVGTAPFSAEGHVNLSPKGLDSFRVLSPSQVAYLDLTGSGNETAAHLIENGRITFLFCAFEGRPKILRLYGRGQIVHTGSPRWPELSALFPSFTGIRQIFIADISRVHTSCGFGVPLMRLESQRAMLEEWAEKKGSAGLDEYRKIKNARSIDGLPSSMNWLGSAGDSR
jgi:hypothetical protein